MSNIQHVTEGPHRRNKQRVSPMASLIREAYRLHHRRCACLISAVGDINMITAEATLIGIVHVTSLL